MAQVISFLLQKGGTGKTTTVANTGYILAEAKEKVAVIDFDPQGNLSLAFGIDPDTLPETIIDVILGECQFSDIKKKRFGVDIYPSSDLLSKFELELIEDPKRFGSPWYVLKNLIESIRDQYDYILIDLPPSLGILSTNGLLASDSLIIPMQTEFFAQAGLRNLVNSLDTFIYKKFNHKIEILGILPTMFDARLNLDIGVLDNVKNACMKSNIKLLSTIIPRTVKFGNAPTKKTLAVVEHPKDPVVQMYREFVKEVFEIG